MNGFGLNSAALNGSVRRVIAGAVLIVASGSISATGLRIVTDTPQFTAAGSLSATGTRVCLGAANTVSNSTLQATPGLLLLSTVNFGTNGALSATNTESYFVAGGSLQATGTDIQNGSAAFVGNSIGTTAIPLYIAGTAAQFNTAGTFSADASVKLSGSSYTSRDGYVNTVPIGGILTANALRTALCYVESDSPSSCSATANVIQGGSSQFIATATLNATGAADSGWMVCPSAFSALGQVTSYPAPIVMAGVLTVSAAQNVLTQGSVNTFTGIAGMAATANLAIQSDALLQATSSLAATGNLAIQSSASLQAMASFAATGLDTQMGSAESYAFGSIAASGGLLIYGLSDFNSASVLIANPLVNADSLDPTERTMIRPFVDRTMLRPFVDRTMKREP
jgi:hypothetical protein